MYVSSSGAVLLHVMVVLPDLNFSWLLAVVVETLVAPVWSALKTIG
jgi:hypothetical protein